MYAIFFYFSITDIKKILEFTDVLNMWFERYFKIKYDWLEYKNVDEFLKTKNKEYNEIFSVYTKNNKWPHNAVKFWNDSFYISVWDFYWKLWYGILKITLEDFDENEEHISNILYFIEFYAFIYKKIDWKINFWEWWNNIDWFKREK